MGVGIEGLDRQIRYFLKIAEAASLSRAADELDVSQSGLSRQLSILENHIGKPLFVRTGRGVALTEAGEKLLAAAQPAYARIDDTLVQLREREGVTEGSLRIATIHTLSYYFVSDLLTRFVSQRKQVNLSILARSSPDVVDLVERGKADVGFVYDSAVASDALESVPVLDHTMCLVVQASQGAACRGADLSAGKIPLVGFPEHYALRRMLKSAELDHLVVAEADTIDSMLQLVSLGMGACILPAHVPERLLADHGLAKVDLSCPRLWRRVVAIVRRDAASTSFARELIELAISTCTAASFTETP